MGLADLHIHTLHSFDGTARVVDVLCRARDIGLDVIAITDHDAIEGTFEALDLAPRFDVEVIPGVEVSTADGDLLAFNVHRLPRRKRSLIDTLLEVGDMGGFCVAAHPMAGGWRIKSLSAYAIRQACHHKHAARALIGIEAYNASALDRQSNAWANDLADRLGLSKTGSSDAHVLSAIGCGATWFPGHTAADLVSALYAGRTEPRRFSEWSVGRIVTDWVWNYTLSVPLRLRHHLALARSARAVL